VGGDRHRPQTPLERCRVGRRRLLRGLGLGDRRLGGRSRLGLRRVGGGRQHLLDGGGIGGRALRHAARRDEGGDHVLGLAGPHRRQGAAALLVRPAAGLRRHQFGPA